MKLNEIKRCVWPNTYVHLSFMATIKRKISNNPSAPSPLNGEKGLYHYFDLKLTVLEISLFLILYISRKIL